MPPANRRNKNAVEGDFFVEKCTLYHVKLAIAIFFIIFNFEKNVLFLIFIQNAPLSQTLLSQKVTKYFTVC